MQLWVSYFVVEVAMIVVAWERMSSAPVISSPCFVGMFLWLFHVLDVIERGGGGDGGIRRDLSNVGEVGQSFRAVMSEVPEAVRFFG